MKYLITICLVIAGLINLYPLIGVISAEELTRLYGVTLESSDLILLMRHRAILFGMLGFLIIFSIFRRSLQPLACIAGLVSMVSFLVLAFGAGQYGEALNKAVIADIIGSAGLVLVLLLRRNAPPH